MQLYIVIHNINKKIKELIFNRIIFLSTSLINSLKKEAKLISRLN